MAMPMKLRLFIVTALVSFSFAAFASFGALETNTSTCKKLLARAGLPPKINFDGFVCLQCYSNVLGIIEELKDNPRFDLKQMNVLYISGFDLYGFHAIIQYGDFIIDPSQNYAAGNKAYLYSRDVYFQSLSKKTTSMVRVIPALDYLKDFDNLGATYYMDGLQYPDSISEHTNDNFPSANKRYPPQTLSDYLGF